MFRLDEFNKKNLKKEKCLAAVKGPLWLIGFDLNK